MKISLPELKEVLRNSQTGLIEAKVDNVSSVEEWVDGIAIDSRKIGKDQAFLCLEGENVDGHDFIQKALDQGASVVFARAEKMDRINHLIRDERILFVNDPLEAASEVATYLRSKIKGNVIGVTGSNGKTSAKDMLSGILKLLGRNVYSTQGNLNNHIGLPMSVWNTPDSVHDAVYELGMNHAGEISHLSKIARPTLAIITGIGTAHIEFFENIEGIARAKLEILDGMEPHTNIAYHKESVGFDLAKRLCQEREIQLHAFSLPTDLVCDAKGIRFSHAGEMISNPNYFSPIMAQNLNGCLVLLHSAGFDPKELARVASEISPATSRRFQLYQGNGHLLIDDSYNANPDSFSKSIEAFRQLLPQGRMLILAGEMAELGSDTQNGHIRVGLTAGAQKIEKLIVVGSPNVQAMSDSYCSQYPKGSTEHFQTVEELITCVETILREFRPDGILVKGSRRTQMDKAADEIRKLKYV